MTNTMVHTRDEIIQEITTAYQAVLTYIKDLSPEAFVHQPNGKWSPMEQLQHLILASKRIPSALNMSKFKLALLGKSKRDSQSYKEVVENYKNLLLTGIKSGPAFSPEPGASWTKEELVGNWMMIQDKFEKRLCTWSEEELDTYRLPHPELGKLTVREMLFFTIYHTWHHLKSMKSKISVE